MGRNPVSVDRLFNYLESRILAGDYRPGELLPSVRRLSVKFELSYGTTYRALERLAAAGVLEQRDNHGFFVGRYPLRAGDGKRKIMVFMEPASNYGGLMAYSALLGMHDRAGMAGYELEAVYRHGSEATTEFFQERSRHCDGMMLLNAFDLYLSNFTSACPVAGVLMQNSFGGRISTINLDPYDTVRQVASYFLHAGIQRVKVFSSPKPIYWYRARIFTQIWADFGGRADLVDASSPTRLEYETGIGYFFSSDDWLNSASSSYFEQYGIRLEDKFVVIGADGKQLLNPDYPCFPSVSADWREIGRIAMDELLRRIGDPASAARNITVCGRLLHADKVRSKG